MAKFKITHSITKGEWNKTPKDYKTVINGVHYVMKLTNSGTALVPVNLVNEDHTADPTDNYVVKFDKQSNPFTPWTVWEGEVRVKSFATKDQAQEYADTQNQEQGLTEGNAFTGALYNARKEGLDEFEFNGKKYPVHKLEEGIKVTNKLTTEGVMKNIDIMIQNAGSFLDFMKEFRKEHPDFDYKNKDLMKWLQSTFKSLHTESINEAVGKEAMGIAAFTATRGNAVQKFIDDYHLNAKELYKFISKGKLKDRQDFATALAGNSGNKYQGKIVGMFGESIKEAAAEPEVITQLRKIVKDKQNALVVDTKSNKKVRVDMQSASLMVQVYDALKQQSNKDKFVKSGIVAMGHMAYKLIKNESVNKEDKENVKDFAKESIKEKNSMKLSSTLNERATPMLSDKEQELVRKSLERATGVGVDSEVGDARYHGGSSDFLFDGGEEMMMYVGRRDDKGYFVSIESYDAGQIAMEEAKDFKSIVNVAMKMAKKYKKRLTSESVVTEKTSMKPTRHKV
jgi:hypothetical protein